MTDNAVKSPVLWMILGGAVLVLSGIIAAVSYRDLLGRGDAEQDAAVVVENTTAVAEQPPAPPAGADRAPDLAHMELLLATLNPQQRAQALDDPAVFRRLVDQETARHATAAAADEAGLEKERMVAFQVQRHSEQVLINAYVQQRLRGRVPAGFPSEAQVQKVYEDNAAKFKTTERVPVWQIFLPITAEMDDQAIARLRTTAEQIRERIRAGKSSFGEEAASYSTHEASRINGGYMGLLNVDSLIPALRSPLLDLKVGAISGVIRGDEGLHILRRGEVIGSQTLPLAQVEPRIRQELVKAVLAKLRDAVVVDARQRFGVPITDAEAEQWRLKLQAQATKGAEVQ